ncbi:MAG: glutamine synthetase III [Bacteriovoracaceae bacterium]|nr:glutamine synthetase III [Bacteriovoracaceae bacterium]
MNQTWKKDSRKSIALRRPLERQVPAGPQGRPLKISQYYGENVFYVLESKSLKKETREALGDVLSGKKTLTKEMANDVAGVVLDWALEKGVTHFCHWFQPLTGDTAEKHDSFLSIEAGRPIEKLSASQLIQGEPDASSFPSGGTRSTFEARGYTTWDLTSPIFIRDGLNGKTLYIPTAFVSYHGDALDAKTPLIRSNNSLGKNATKFLTTAGFKDVDHVQVTCGVEQEYFLVDKIFAQDREDIIMTGRSLIGSLTSRNQQLEDHYFGTIPDRVLAFMQDVEIELYRLGIPAKTRHNEVAPGQFELAPIFTEANVANDQNKLVMSTLRQVADRHGFLCMLHEKPFKGINGSGKHLNWSMSDNKGRNLLEPSKTPHENTTFLAIVAVVCQAVFKRSIALRASIASHSNDHRLGANEAPPSIISVFLGDTLTKILETLIADHAYTPEEQKILDLGANQLANLLKDNTDRNRTSPFAFTGNKFEFRAVGSSASIGLPLAVLNAAVSDSFAAATTKLETYLSSGLKIQEALQKLTKEIYKECKAIVFNGDGYSSDWVKEAEKRGLPNYRTTPDSLIAFGEKKNHEFLTTQNVFTESELHSLNNVSLERYIKYRSIEVQGMKKLVDRFVLPAAFAYKNELAQTVYHSKEISCPADVELSRLTSLAHHLKEIDGIYKQLNDTWAKTHHGTEEEVAKKIANEIMPLVEKIATECNVLEDSIPESYWPLPSYFDLLFLR